MRTWRRLCESEIAHKMYLNSPLFHLLIDYVRVAEESGSGVDAVALFGELVARACEKREAWMQREVERMARVEERDE